MVPPPSWRALVVLGISSAVVFAVANEEETCSTDGSDTCGAAGDALLQQKRRLNREEVATLSEVDAETGITGMTSSWLSSFFKGEAQTSNVQSKVSDDGKTAAVNFRHEGKDVSYVLRSFSVWSEDARLFAHTEQGEVERPIPARHSFQARDNDNNHGLWASAVVHDNMVTGLFQLEGGRVLRIEHVNTSQSGKPSMMEVENSHTMQLVDLSRIFSGKKCVMVDGECVHDGGDDGKDGINHVPTMSDDADEEGLIKGTATWTGVKWYPGCYSGDNVLNEFKMGAVMDVDGFQEHGAQAAPLLEKAFAESSFVYEQQLNVKLSIGYLKIWETETGAPNYAVGCSPVLKLSEFKARAAQDMPAGLGASHIFTGCGTGYGTVGKAWVGTICRTDGYNTGTNQFHKSKDWLTFAHELGHNFAGKHSFEEGQGKTGGIMDYGDGLLDGTYQFNTKYRKQEMCNKMNQVINKCGGGFKEAPPQGTWRVTSGKCTTDSAGCLRSPSYKDSSESLTQYGWGSRRRSGAGTDNNDGMPDWWSRRRSSGGGGSGGGDDWWTRRRTTTPTTTTTTTTQWTDQYPNDAECTVTVVEESKPIKVVHFSTEEGDELSVNGVAYWGTGEGLAGIVPRGTMTWKSNAAGTSTGFKICPSDEEPAATPAPKPPAGTPAPPPPPPPPDSATPAPGPSPPPAPSGDPAKWVAYHNYWRCIHGSPPIAWDTDFAIDAQKWADRGVMEHADCYNIKPPYGPAGENLASGSAGYMSIKKAVDMWHDENPEKGPKCGGHCTAMLWKAAKKLGCGINPSSNSGMLLVCRYGGGNPLPNMGGQYEANVGFPDMSKAAACKAQHIDNPGSPSPPPPANTPAPPTSAPPGPSPSPPPSPTPGSTPSPELAGELGKLKEQWSETEEAIEKLEEALDA